MVLNLVLTPGPEGMKGAIGKAKNLLMNMAILYLNNLKILQTQKSIAITTGKEIVEQFGDRT